jgi:hypothetical protein
LIQHHDPAGRRDLRTEHLLICRTLQCGDH